MPANDSMSHRGARTARAGHRFTPYAPTESVALKAHASCPAIFFHETSSLVVASPEETALDPPSEISSTATLVNPSFDSDKDHIPTPLITDCSTKLSSPKQFHQQRQIFHQRKVDYVGGLIDYTCKVLNDIWALETIPAVFRYQCGANFGYTSSTAGRSIEEFKLPKGDNLSDLISLRKFVSELLRRSRSTCATLQTALCYIEAVRHKIPEFQQDEKEGRGIRGEQVNNVGRITIDETCYSPEPAEPSACKLRKSLPKTPLPPLPSALLCPRRAFMGALVLSAKFVQDKCYSNKAWAKICGLPAREVSRCERALGDALGWRLWVGKDSPFGLAGLESKVGRAPTMVLPTTLAFEDKKDCTQERPLGRAQTWSTGDFLDQQVTFIAPLSETEYTSSPTPSLTYSSSGSSCSSSTFTPSILSPSPSFVPSDPSFSATLTKCNMAKSMFTQVCNAKLQAMSYPHLDMLSMSCNEDDLGIRVGEVF